MSEKSTPGDLQRINVDIPRSLYQKLKIRSALDGKPMREILISALEAKIGDTVVPQDRTE